MIPLIRTVSYLDEKKFSMDVKPAGKKHLKAPSFIKRLTLKVVFDGRKSKSEKESGAERLVSAPVPRKDTTGKDIV
ncbi:hypothetical protein FRC01_002744, partial [Tulasnella sp. 417]